MPIIVAGDTAQEEGVGPGVPGTVLQERSASLGSIIFGAVDDLGTLVRLNDVKGWVGGVGTTGEVTQRVAADGGWANLAYRTPRSLELDVTLVATDYERIEASVEAIMAAVPVNKLQDLLIQTKSRVLSVAVRQDDGDVLQRITGNVAQLSIPLIAPDPRKYSLETVTASTGLPQTTGGLSLPLSVPLAVPATVTSGLMTVTNEGTADTPPTFTVSGPCPPFAITHRETNATLRFADSIAAGRALVIDTAQQRALMDGTATRTVVGTWFTYLGKADGHDGTNTVAFTADSYDAGALLTSQHRSAHL